MALALFCLTSAAFLFCEGLAIKMLVTRSPLTLREALPYVIGAALAGAINIPFIIYWGSRL